MPANPELDETAEAPTEWLNLSQACAIAGLSATTLRRFADDGTVPCWRSPGNQRRFRRVDIVALLTPNSDGDQAAS